MNIEKCPCGGEALLFKEHRSIIPKNRERWFYVACCECLSRGELLPSHDNAVSNWNEKGGEL